MKKNIFTMDVLFGSVSTVTVRCRRDLYYPYGVCVIRHTFCCSMFRQVFPDLQTLKKCIGGLLTASRCGMALR